MPDESPSAWSPCPSLVFPYVPVHMQTHTDTHTASLILVLYRRMSVWGVTGAFAGVEFQWGGD